MTQQLKDALSAKSELQLALTSQLRRSQAEVQAALSGVVSADEDLDAAAEIARAHEAAAVGRREREMHAVRLVDCTHRLAVLETNRDLRWALHEWRTASELVDLVDVFHDVNERTQALGLASEAMAEELSRLQFAETGGLAIDQLRLLHETSKEVMQSEMGAAEAAAHAAQKKLAMTSNKLRKREDDLVLLIQSYETLRDDHAALSHKVEAATDGSAAHVARLEAQLQRAQATSADKNAEIRSLLQRREQLAGQLALREKQLALCVSHLEQGKTESDTLRTIGSAEERRLRSTLDDHDAQLVHLVKELYELATAERVPGVVAHEARSRVFRRCALVYEMLGEGAFRKADENVATAAQALEALGGYSSGQAAAGDTHRVP